MMPRRRAGTRSATPFKATRSTRAKSNKALQDSHDSPLSRPISPESKLGGLVASNASNTIPVSAQKVLDAVEMLRQFDMTPEYGPCVGISRTRRWRRAERFHLSPPLAILSILQDSGYRDAIPDIEENLWRGVF